MGLVTHRLVVGADPAGLAASAVWGKGLSEIVRPIDQACGEGLLQVTEASPSFLA